MLYFIVASLFLLPIWTQAQIYPIQFSIPETKIIDQIPKKTRHFASLIPGDMNTYIFENEKDYYEGYQNSYFAFTWKKGGWDCMRHYEILANGCIPYFVGLETTHPNNMVMLPKELILEAMHLPGVHHGWIDESVFDFKRYYEIVDELLKHTRKYLSTKSTAARVLETMHYSGKGKVLFLSEEIDPDYLRCCTLIGLKELLGEAVVDYPKIPHIYKNYADDPKKIYGKGFSYTRIVEDLPIDRDDIENRIRSREFELVIYGSVHRGMPFLELVQEVYGPDRVCYLCGDDCHRCIYAHLPHFFLREAEAGSHLQ